MKRANRYRVSGGNKKAGAIGNPESFTVEVSAQDVEEAHNAARAARYAAGFEHVHIVRVQIIQPET